MPPPPPAAPGYAAFVSAAAAARSTRWVPPPPPAAAVRAADARRCFHVRPSRSPCFPVTRDGSLGHLCGHQDREGGRQARGAGAAEDGMATPLVGGQRTDRGRPRFARARRATAACDGVLREFVARGGGGRRQGGTGSGRRGGREGKQRTSRRRRAKSRQRAATIGPARRWTAAVDGVLRGIVAPGGGGETARGQRPLWEGHEPTDGGFSVVG